jgi:hypothetical protein
MVAEARFAPVDCYLGYSDGAECRSQARSDDFRDSHPLDEGLPLLDLPGGSDCQDAASPACH